VYIESAFEVLRCFFFQDTTPSPYRKVDINSRGLDGKTALHFASLYGFEQIANVLLKHGAIANITDYNRKCTPLHLACQYNHPKVWYIFTA
jgi:ankyrin repeat protein